MQIRPDQFAAHLRKGPLAPVYLVTGDEPLQLSEAADLVRENARANGFTERRVFDAQTGFDWRQLIAEADSLSLFADKRLLDLRIPGGKLGTDGGQVLVDYLSRISPDNLLLVTLPKLDKNQRNAKWYKAVERDGVVVAVWPVERQALSGWILQRARHAGISLEPDAAAFIAAQTEGNLLAAAQEVDKLTLLSAGGTVDLKQATESVSGSARYNVFELGDALLKGDVAQGLRILRGLRAEGSAPLVALWSFTRELRALSAAAQAGRTGRDPSSALAALGIWKSRQSLVITAARRHSPSAWRRLLQQCALVDRAVKGQASADPWQVFEDVMRSAVGRR